MLDLLSRNERKYILTAPYVSPEQVRDIVGRNALGDLPADEMPLLDFVRGRALYEYCRCWPSRQSVIVAYLRGTTPTEASRGERFTDRAARSWVAHYLVFASEFATRVIIRERDRDDTRDILRSICSLTHGRTERGGSGGRPKIRAVLCPGCLA